MCASVLVVLLDGKFLFYFILLFAHITIQDYEMCNYIWNFKSMIPKYRQIYTPKSSKIRDVVNTQYS